MIYYDFPGLSTMRRPQIIENTSSLIDSKFAYIIAVILGYEGTEEEWMENLQGADEIVPYIGENGHWFIGDFDTNIPASSGNFNLDIITNEDIDSYFNSN